jgi:hypothetical protein
LDTHLRQRLERLLNMRKSLVEARKRHELMSLDEVRTFFREKSLRLEEFNGSDVHFCYTLEVTLPNENLPREVETFDAWIEIKSYLGDDYPSALRQMELQRKQAANQKMSSSRFILVIGKFGARGVTLDQLRKIFALAHFDVVMLEELGCAMPRAPSHQAESLPLFQA